MMMPMHTTLTLPLSRRTITLNVRYSERASLIRLRITPAGIPELVIPAKASEQLRTQALAFAEEKAQWLEKILIARENTQESPLLHNPAIPPTDLKLLFCGHQYRIEYKTTDVVWTGVRPLDGNRLLLSGNTAEWKHGLREWLKRNAQTELFPFAEAIRIQGKFPEVQWKTGLQKRLWGSCSARGIISLNAALQFFPKEIVRGVVLHELCHRYEMNHSKRFWMLVSRFCPEHKTLRNLLNRKARMLPRWIFSD